MPLRLVVTLEYHTRCRGLKFFVKSSKFVFVLFCDQIVYSSHRWEIYMDFKFCDTNLATKITNPTKITSIQYVLHSASYLASKLVGRQSCLVVPLGNGAVSEGFEGGVDPCDVRLVVLSSVGKNLDSVS